MKKRSRGFIMLPHALVDGDGFARLSSHATRLLVLVLRRHNGRNNGAIELSVRDAASWLHVAKSTAFATLAELQAAHLIEPVHRAHFAVKTGGSKKGATTWRLLIVDEETRLRTAVGTVPVAEP